MNKRARTTEIIGLKDPTSVLPQHIMHKIVGLLPPQEAMATALLSRAWRDVWMNLPCLDLGHKIFYDQMKNKLRKEFGTSKSPRHSIYSRPRFRDKLKKQFLDFVDQTLILRQSQLEQNPVSSLELCMPNCAKTLETSARLDGWINRAINNVQVKELTLYNDFARNAPYKFPRNVFAANSESLKRLSLHNVQVDQDIVNCLATSCPLIESLCFYSCHLLSHILKVCGFSRLDELVVNQDKYVTELFIDAPNLGSLDYQERWGSPKTLFNIEVTSPICLRYLRICNAFCSSSPQLVALLSNVENLVLSYCEFSGDLFISSKVLKKLVLSTYDMVAKIKIKINAPYLKDLFWGLQPSSHAINYGSLEKGTFDLNGAETGADLVDFLTKLKFNHCEKLELFTSWRLKDLEIPQHLRKAAKCILYDVKHLMLKLRYKLPVWDIVVILDSLLLLCPNPQTISISILTPAYDESVAELKVFKFKYFKQGENGANKCSQCNSLLALCWQHHLQEVSIETGYNAKVKDSHSKQKAITKDDENVKAFFEDAREEEKIAVEYRTNYWKRKF